MSKRTTVIGQTAARRPRPKLNFDKKVGLGNGQYKAAPARNPNALYLPDRQFP
jgi:hypothetical protein